MDLRARDLKMLLCIHPEWHTPGDQIMLFLYAFWEELHLDIRWILTMFKYICFFVTAPRLPKVASDRGCTEGHLLAFGRMDNAFQRGRRFFRKCF
jgi:hypothetical protein